MVIKSIIQAMFFILSTPINIYWRLTYSIFRSKFSVSQGFKFNGHHILFYGDGSITCGSGSYIGDGSTVHAASGYEVVIGEGCHISSNVRIFTQTAIADADFSAKPVPSRFGNVFVGNYCWIGANVLINPGVSIGDNVVIGANSVVCKDVPAGQIWGGVPARYIRTKNKYNPNGGVLDV